MVDHGDLSIARPVVIVIDDDDAVRSSLKFALEIEGYAVCAFASPGEALRAGNLSRSSCLIVDQNMPGMSGLHLLAALRKQGIGVPAILVSGHVTAALRSEAARRDVSIVEKPFPGSILVDRIRALIPPASN